MKDEPKAEFNNSLKLLVKSSIFVFIGLMLSKVFTYVYRFVIARYFGPEVYGLFSLSVMVLLWFILFFSLGLNEGVLRFISFYRGKNEPEKIKYIFRLGKYFLLSSGVLAGIVLYFLSDFIAISIFHNPNLAIFLKIISISIPFYTVAYELLSVIQAFERIKIHSFISDFLRNFVQLIALVALIFLGIKTNSVIFSYFFGILIIFLLAYGYCRCKIPEIFKKCELSKSLKSNLRKELFYYSIPLTFSGILCGFFSYIDSFIIGIFRDASEVGFYNAALPIAALMTFCPMIFLRLFFPLMTKEFSKNNFEVMNNLSKQIQKWILIVNLPIFILLFLFPGAFINLLFDSRYLVAETSLKILAIGFLFYSLSMILESLISAIGKSRIILTNIILCTILSFILNMLLIPKFGMNGAAFSTMIVYIFLNILLFFEVRYYASINPLKRDMIKVFLSVIPPAILLFFIRRYIEINLLTLIAQGLFFVLFYLLLIFLTKSLDKNDYMILGTLYRKLSDSDLKFNKLYKWIEKYIKKDVL
jgi:O-antigen/teichoic acid export membrane protein